jgi:hypothetical protein
MPPIDTVQVSGSNTGDLNLPYHRTPHQWGIWLNIARIPSSPPADHCLASDGHSSQTTELLENLMSFLQQSDLKKHLSTRSGNMPTHHNEAVPPGGSRVILRDGNLITLPLGEEVVETARIDRANTSPLMHASLRMVPSRLAIRVLQFLKNWRGLNSQYNCWIHWIRHPRR